MSLQPPYARAPALLQTTASVPFIRLDGRPDTVLRLDRQAEAPGAAKRSKIWELSDTLHCSIIGTCLSNAELRNILQRLGAPGVDVADEHELHVIGVSLAGRRDNASKLVQKALDRRHGMAIRQYARAKDEESLFRLWDESLQSGDIPGAYWAVLSHPAATEAVVRKAFRDVHMLSHLVGAANRADIRRLRQLEDELGSVKEKLARQQEQLQEGFKSRDDTIRRLNRVLVRQAEHQDDGSVPPLGAGAEIEALRNVIVEVNRKLGQESARRERLEQRLDTTSTTLQKAEAALRNAERERDALTRDLELVEGHLIALLQPATDERESLPELSGWTVLYVGGRPNQVPQIKALVERTGARFLHHDGGIEHGATLLPGLVSKADHVFFPVDCVSHDAVATIKRICRQLEKPYHPLRTASVAALIASLAAACQDGPTTIAAE